MHNPKEIASIIEEKVKLPSISGANNRLVIGSDFNLIHRS